MLSKHRYWIIVTAIAVYIGFTVGCINRQATAERVVDGRVFRDTLEIVAENKFQHILYKVKDEETGAMYIVNPKGGVIQVEQ